MRLKIVSKKATGNNVRLLISYAHQTRHLFATGVCIPSQDYKHGHIANPVSKANPNADHYNKQVSLLYYEILSIISTLRREDKVPTADLVHYIYYRKEQVDLKRLTLRSSLAIPAASPQAHQATRQLQTRDDLYNDDRYEISSTKSKATRRGKNFPAIYEEFLAEKAFTAATLKLYTPMYTRLMECFPDLDIEKFDGAAWMTFRKHLEKEGLASNTVCIRMNKAKAMIKYLKESMGYNIPIRSFPLPKEVKKIFLNLTDLKKVMSYESVTESLARTKDLLLFQCHTGLRISDLKRVSEIHLQKVDDNYFIQMNAFKTNVPLMIPLNQQALAVLHRYNFKLPEMTEQAYNRDIKTLLKNAGVSTTVEWRAYDSKGNKIFKSGKICEVFTNHCSSRTAIRYFFLSATHPIR